MHDITELVTGIVLLMLFAAFTSIAVRRIPKVPLTIALVFVGMGLHELAVVVPVFDTLRYFELTPELVLFVFIPTLIYESATNLDARQLYRNILPILTLAVPGLLLSTVLIAGVMNLLSPFDFMVCLLLGAILSATDPVAVIAIFKQLGVPERLTVLVEGESLFNDATSLVLATIIIAIIVAGGFDESVVLDGFGEFLVVFTGGVLVGWGLAMAAGFLLGAIESEPAIEITLTTILAYLSFIIAEHVFHVSGIMAVVAAGLVIGSWGKSKISPSTAEFMEHFWEYLAYLANALIFLMVGLQIDLMTLLEAADLIGFVVLAMLISRAVVVFGLVPLSGRVPGAEKIGLRFQQVMYWGGLRGAIALAIVLSLPGFEYKDTLVAVVMGAVLFTLVAQGLTIELLVKTLGLNSPDISDQLARLEGERDARNEGLSRLDRLAEDGLFSRRVADHLKARCEASLAELADEISARHGQMASEDALKILGLRCLAREKARIYELFSQGLISEWAFRELDYTVNVQLDEVRHQGLMPTTRSEVSLAKAAALGVVNLLARLPDVTGIVERQRTQRIVRDYDVAWGRYRSAGSVLSRLDRIGLETEADPALVRQVKGVYDVIRDDARRQIDQVAEQFPEFVETMQEHLGERLLLIAEHDAVESAAEHGLLQHGVADAILAAQSERIRQLKQDDLSACFEIGVMELLQKVPLFEGMAEEDFVNISGYLAPRTVPRGLTIIRQGAAGDSMFLVARGILNVAVTASGSEERQVATLYAGDIFGESALLHEAPRNATVIAATPCSLYELRRVDLDRLCYSHPRIRLAVEQVDKERLTSNTA